MGGGGKGVEGEKRDYLAALPREIGIQLTRRAIASLPGGVGDVD